MTGKGRFPLEYLDGVLAEAQTIYRVDAKRIYVTGLSLGGEATYRFAIAHPDSFAAIAPLCASLEGDQIALLDRIRSLPVWAIHGAHAVVPLAAGQEPVDVLKELGGNIRSPFWKGTTMMSGPILIPIRRSTIGSCSTKGRSG